MRLDKYISEAVGCTRSESRDIIKKGRISVVCSPSEAAVDAADKGKGRKNTEAFSGVVKKHDAQIDEQAAAEGRILVLMDGIELKYRKFVYIMLNKPEGVVSASKDPSDRTVVDLVKDFYPRRELFPAGRLDKTSTGFVLITDDGVFAHDILAPKKHVSKTYTVVLDRPLTEEMVSAFRKGVTLADGTGLSPADAEPVSTDGMTVKMFLHQGVYHQIKRMFGIFDAGVNALHRDAIGGLELDPSLKPGEWRELSAEEIARIRMD